VERVLDTSEPSPRREWRFILAFAAILAGSYAGWRYFVATHPADAAVEQRAGGEPPKKGPPAIPVTVAEVRKGDFQVYLNGLGTVQPYDTVTVRSRVDGEIIKIGFKQGQMVKEGDVLVQIDPRPYQAALDQARAKKAQDEATLKDAQLNLKRYQDLAKQDFASHQQLDTQQALVNQLTAQIQGDQAAIDNAQTQLGYTTIKAPLSGKTGFRNIDPGNIVHASDQNGIVTIVKLQPISVVFTAPEENLPQINKALEGGMVPVTALSSDGLRVLSEGHLALVDNAVDQASGTIRMKATFANEDNVLWPGLSVSTKLLVGTLKDAVVVPEDAVERGPNGLYAFVIGDDAKAEIRPIKVGNSGNGQAVVVKGLAAGEKVVVAGQYRLQPGSLVAPREADAQAPAKEAENTAVKAP
jgi:multidrug efflux system membrane fusion protein